MAFVAFLVVVLVLFFNFLVYCLNECSYPWRLVGASWPSLFFTTNRASGVHMKTRPSTFYAWELHDPADLWQSRLPRGVAALLALRIVALLCFVFVTLFQGLAPRSLASGLHTDFLPYFTNWTFVGFGLYAVLGIAVCWRGMTIARYQALKSSVDEQWAPTAQYDMLDKAFTATLTTVSSSSVFLSVFYWVVLYHGEPVLLENVFKHGGTVIIFVAEYLTSRVPVASAWFQWPTLYSTIYAAFMWINWAARHRWVYWVFDWRDPANLVYYAIMPCLGFGGFMFVYGVAGLREFLATGKCCSICFPCCCCCGSACQVETPQALEHAQIWQDDDTNSYISIELGVMPVHPQSAAPSGKS